MSDIGDRRAASLDRVARAFLLTASAVMLVALAACSSNGNLSETTTLAAPRYVAKIDQIVGSPTSPMQFEVDVWIWNVGAVAGTPRCTVKLMRPGNRGEPPGGTESFTARSPLSPVGTSSSPGSIDVHGVLVSGKPESSIEFLMEAVATDGLSPYSTTDSSAVCR